MVAGSLASSLYVGTAGELIEAREDNPRGFFERRDVVDCNDRLLASADSSWFNPGAGPLPADAAARSHMRDILARLGKGPWLLKDPRLLLTWEAWQPLLGDALPLFVYRGPEAVADSLEKRNGLPLDYGLALWQHYNRRALGILEGREFVAVCYEDVAADPERGLETLFAELQSRGVAADLSQLNPESGFDRRLDHSPAGEHSVRGLLGSRQLALHEACLQLVHDGSTAAVGPAMEEDGTVERLQSLARAFSRTIDARQTAQELEEKRSELTASVVRYDALHAEHSALARVHEQNNEELAFLRKAREDLTRDLSNATELVEQTERTLADTSAKADYLFYQLELNYDKLLSFSESALGRCHAALGRLYKLVTGRRHRNTAFEDVLTNARQFYEQHPRPPSVAASRSRVRLLIDALAYMAAHPASTLRSVSWPRLRRAVAVFLDAERDDLSLWVKQRFPGRVERRITTMLPSLDSELDTLTLDFPAVDKPRVSIVIPVFNQYRMTIFCLRSLLEHSGDVAYEVILADDASTDLTATIEQRVGGLVVERGLENRGFLRNCNAGAARARGEYLLLLNNDTGLTAGWLSKLVGTLDAHADAAVAGPKLLFGNGVLQEAGGIVWDDASGWNYGRLDRADLPEYNYLREVDYVSGACLLVRYSLWSQLGGFDRRYVPAYYEDTDLCFSAREAGFRVLYQPAAVVFHFEGVSHGTDPGSGAKRHQLDNQDRFLEKWRAVLQRDHYPNGECLFRARDRSRHRRTVMVIDHYVPSFDRDAGSRSTWQYLRLLVEMGYNVKFMGANFFPHQPYTAALQQAGIEVLAGESLARNVGRWLQVHAGEIDTVYIHRPQVAEQFLDLLKKMQPRPTLVFFGHDLHYLRKQREYEVTLDPAARAEADQWRQREYRVFEQVDRVYYPSQVEVDEIHRHCADVPVRVLPLYVLEDGTQPLYEGTGREGMLFVGGFSHSPNGDGVRWFVDEILSAVRERAPRLDFHIVGSNMPRWIENLPGEGVVIHGYQDDAALEAIYRRVKMVVVPLRYGAGVKGKVVEALQHGVPVVTTGVGAEGLPDAGKVLHLAEDAREFTETILRVDAGGPEVTDRLRAYGDYLAGNFGKVRAREIIAGDFGEPML